MSPSAAVLAHDSVTAYGGGERTLEALFPLLPDAPLFTAVFRPPVSLADCGRRAVRTSFLQRAPLPTRLLKPLFPLAFASLRPPADTELILSSSSGYAKGLRHPRAVHVTYVHTPIRRVWNTYHRAARRPPRGPLNLAESLTLRMLRRWDLVSMRRVHHVVANSQNTAGQIQRIYGRAHSDRLAFIRHSRELGFPLDAIRQLLTLADDPAQPCATADRIAQEQLVAVQARIARLEALKVELERMVEQCRHGTIGHCRVIEVLADHSHGHCLHADHGTGEDMDTAA